MKPRLLFVFPSFEIGGTTVSARNLIALLGKDGYDCWVMPLIPKGPLEQLFDDVSQVKAPFTMKALALRQWNDESTWPRRFAAMLHRTLCSRSSWFEAWSVGRSLDRIVRKLHFDAILAQQEGRTTRLVSHASLQKKVAWVRCDYRRRIEENHFERELFQGIYDRFYSIVCVSEKTFNGFKELFPEFAMKTVCIPNPQDVDMMQKRADMDENEPRFTTEDITLVSVGRLDAIKRFDQIAPIARQLKERGLCFHWYIIGDGVERGRIEGSIVEFGMESEVIMLGVKANPYYYIKRADALICLSRSEACPRVVNEAKILHTPTISTVFPTIYEFIENGKTGIIIQMEKMPEAILNFFNNDELRMNILTNINSFSFDNTELVTQIETLFN